MPTPLYRLVYRSRTATEVAPAEQQRELAAILAAARARNARLRLTGALMLQDGAFVQVLEGELAALEAVFESICRDQRHTALTLIELTPIDARAFTDWSMAWISEDAAAALGAGNALDATAPLAAAQVPAFVAAMQAAVAGHQARGG
jgi:hypothetical protein